MGIFVKNTLKTDDFVMKNKGKLRRSGQEMNWNGSGQARKRHPRARNREKTALPIEKNRVDPAGL